MSAVMAQKKIVYHVDDIVRIVEPRRFIRVGYPLTKEQALEAAEKEYAKEIQAFMATVNAAQSDDPYFNSPEYDPRLYGDLLNAMATRWLRLKGYGGKERSIHTEMDESLRGTVWRVVNKRTVKTGIYNNGGYHGGYWDGEPDYMPPHLSNEQSHVLLTLELVKGNCDPWGIEIEAANVELANDHAASEG